MEVYIDNKLVTQISPSKQKFLAPPLSIVLRYRVVETWNYDVLMSMLIYVWTHP